MILKPDLDAVYVDPFSATPMLILISDIVEPGTGALYNRDPRSHAKSAESYVKAAGFGDTVYVGPEAEFFMFEDVKLQHSLWTRYSAIVDIHLTTTPGKYKEAGKYGQGPPPQAPYLPREP